jgi:hypothetical protein
MIRPDIIIFIMPPEISIKGFGDTRIQGQG